MVSTDTVVGIAGAALLAVVMVGVFVYEYNNAEGTTPVGGGTGGPPSAAEAFQARFPTLSATDDLDGDGIDNVDDADLDGDGSNNTADPDVVVFSSMSGMVGVAVQPATNPSVTLDVPAGQGIVAITATVTVTSAQPHNLVVQLLGPDGTVLDDMGSTAGTPNSFTLTSGELVLEPGTYAVRVSQNTVGAGANFDIEAKADYGAPRAA